MILRMPEVLWCTILRQDALSQRDRQNETATTTHDLYILEILTSLNLVSLDKEIENFVSIN